MAELESTALAQLRERWEVIFRTLHDGGEVAPALRLRAEGMMETLVLLGLAPAGDLQRDMDDVYLQVYGQRLADVWGEKWETLFPFPQIPGFGRRAPVHPSTRD